jgi:hypothetical protein
MDVEVYSDIERERERESFIGREIKSESRKEKEKRE